MSASPSRRRARPVLTAALVVLALAAAAALAFLVPAWNRIQALQKGAAFVFGYTAEGAGSAAYGTLEALGALEGSIAGVSSGDNLYLSWYDVGAEAFSSEQAPGPDEAFTDLYVVDRQVYLNVKQIYRSFRAGLTEQYPLAGSLLPDWALGDYVTGAQLARLLGAAPASAGLEEYSISAFAPGQMERVQPAGAREGYLYFTPKQPMGGAEVVVGFPLRSLWADFFYCHVLVEIPNQGLRFELDGKALPYESAIDAPPSVMLDEDIDALADIFEAARTIMAFVREITGQLQ